MKIAFVTQASHPDIEDDDRPLAEALVARGAVVIGASWGDESFPWHAVDLALLRSTWDYFHRYERFLEWLGRVESETRVVNPPDLVRWNANKRYLRALEARGVRTVPTAFIGRGEAMSLDLLCQERGWNAVVLKPVVSANSWETILVTVEQRRSGQDYLDRHRASREIMVQPFLEDVHLGGEHSLMFFGGTYSHAVRKTSPFKDELRLGPEGIPIEPGTDAIDMARDVLSKAGLPEVPYARVDLARDEEGLWVLLELELFEPTLFFREKPGSEEALARILMPGKP